eukprot:scaffold32409_cov112-Isochrysis_galbana.AAC.2
MCTSSSSSSSSSSFISTVHSSQLHVHARHSPKGLARKPNRKGGKRASISISLTDANVRYTQAPDLLPAASPRRVRRRSVGRHHRRRNLEGWGVRRVPDQAAGCHRAGLEAQLGRAPPPP